MRVPQFERYVKGVQMLGVLLLGMLLGAIIYNSMYHAQFEALVNLKSDLEVKLEQTETEIKGLTQFKNQHTVIKSVVPRIEEEAGQNTDRPKLDKVTEAELIKRIKADLSVFLGQSIYEIDTDAQLARRLLSNKIYTNVLEKDYSIDITTILVVENRLQVWVKVRLYSRPPS
ncbi:hypothetical protein PghCCS26_40760 [Paenibacillus glycanilyticus]|uniref:Sporulation membrane protein YtrI C-terminal domain-containing protein n=1 Tax=Paenibacillus glycanilyticus TaxID=126569 RepID=A0ABQ6NPA9_9BACL|nr:hypothetical protein [Paenibacillus glycanilyticus]GMK46947.1 hypothetical protein PghCCS26_40760 [Paenibacillus glycanilyticus]